MQKKKPRRASRSAAPRGWAFDTAAKIVEELFALGDEPRSPTIRIEFKGGTSGSERGQGGMCQIATIDWMARALVRHAPNTSMSAGERSHELDAFVGDATPTIDGLDLNNCIPFGDCDWIKAELGRKLERRVRAAIRRMETIRETHPDIQLDADLRYLKEPLIANKDNKSHE